MPSPPSPPRSCPTGFDDTLVSGYLDEELTQGDAQRVRLHLEDCAPCRQMYAELGEIRAASRSTPFRPPPDDGWDERPRGSLSLVSRNVGWLLLGVWAVVVVGVALWALATSPGTLLEKLIPVSVGGAVVLLFLSVLLDRLRTLKTDRYRRVQK